jgi:PKD repeat protein
VHFDRRLPIVQLLFARPRNAAYAVAAGGLVACSGGDLVLPRDGTAAAIEVVDGDEQTGSVGQPLSDPVAVEVRDAAGAPVQGATVQFAFTSAGDGAQVAPETTETDTLGRAEAHVVLGSKIGLQTGEVRVLREGADPLLDTFSAVAFADDNHPPVAGFGWDCDALVCRFNDTSADDDGNVAGWSWRFGDGDTSTEREPTHRYGAPGSYTVTLTVTDDGGAADEAAEQVLAAAASPPPASNAPPQAEFELDCDDLRCSFTDRSDDSDGDVVRRQWSFGDGASSDDRNPSHTYAAPGQYEVRLVVTDDDGAEDDRTRTAEPDAPAPPPPPPPPPPPSNDPPSADFEVECQELRCVFVDRSADPDGSVVRWQWSFGDGASSSERNPSHSYQASGRYDVLLVVTDDDGAADSRTHSAEPKAPEANQPPRAEFEVHCDHLTCAFEDKSSDEDGVIVSRQWSFGDGATSGEQNPTHSYAERGKYDVQLTVRDDDGASATKSHRADVKD